MIVYYLPFVFSSLLALISARRALLYWGVAVFLVAMCALQGRGVSEDHGNYIDYFTSVVTGQVGPFFVEPTFYLLAKISSILVGSDIFLFFFYALLGVGIKFYVMGRATPYSFLSVCVYISYFFLLQEFTQIRIGVATGFILGAAYLAFQGESLKSVLLLFLGALFHYSVILFLPFLLLRSAGFRAVFFLYLCCCVLFVLYLFNVSLLRWGLNFFSIFNDPRFDFYVQNILSGQGGGINLFRAAFHFAILSPLVLFFDRVKCQHPFVAYAIALHLCGLIVLFALHDAQVLAYRFSDIFNHFMVFSLLAYVILFGRVVGAAGVLAVSMFQIIYVLQVLGFVQPYTSIMGGL